MKTLIFVLTLIFTQLIWAELSPLAPKKELSFSIERESIYTHAIELDIYLLQGAILEEQWLQENLQRAQNALNSCGIRLDIRSAAKLNNGEDWLEWEDVEFNSGQFSEWEQIFFTHVDKDSSGILMTNTLNWSDDPELYHGIGYAPFLTRYFDFSKEQLDFYQNKMAGHVVLGKYAGKWTLIHEIGHAVMNLEHVESDPGNIMFPYNKYSHATFSMEQCEKAKRQVRVHPLQ